MTLGWIQLDHGVWSVLCVIGFSLLIFHWDILHLCSSQILACNFLSSCYVCLIMVSGWWWLHKMTLGVFSHLQSFWSMWIWLAYSFCMFGNILQWSPPSLNFCLQVVVFFFFFFKLLVLYHLQWSVCSNYLFCLDSVLVSCMFLEVCPFFSRLSNLLACNCSQYIYSDSEVAQSCLTLCDPMDSSQPISSVHGIFQARVLEWVDISFSSICMYVCMCVYIYIYIFLLFHFFFSLFRCTLFSSWWAWPEVCWFCLPFQRNRYWFYWFFKLFFLFNLCFFYFPSWSFLCFPCTDFTFCFSFLPLKFF